MFTQNPNGHYKCEGIIPTSIYQFHETVSISDELYKDAVKQGKSGRGRFLISDSFGSCMAVCAKLKNGEFAIYHAEQPYSNAVGFQDFVKSIKGQVEEIFVFQKPTNRQNEKRTPILAIELQVALELKEVKRINIPEGYSSIVTVSDQDKQFVILSKEVKRQSEEKKEITSSEKMKRIIDVTDVKNTFSIMDSAKELIQLKKRRCFKSFVVPRSIINQIDNKLKLDLETQIKILKSEEHSWFAKKNPALSACLEFLVKGDELNLRMILLEHKADIAANPIVKELVKRTLKLSALNEIELGLTFEKESKEAAVGHPVKRFGF